LGRILNTHYNDYLKASELIDGGDMSSCWTEGHCDDSTDGSYGPEYYSKRGEDCPPRLDKNLSEYLSKGEEYAYLFTNGEWVCYDLHGDSPQLVEIPMEVSA
jgi:hypothetical protein